MNERATDADDFGEFVDHGLEEAAQAAILPNVKLAMVPELLAALQGPAVRSVLAARVAMFLKGHTPENDDLLPVGWLPRAAGRALAAVHQHMHQHCCGDRGDYLDEARARLVEAAAHLLAAVDRIDRAVARAPVARPANPTGVS